MPGHSKVSPTVFADTHPDLPPDAFPQVVVDQVIRCIRAQDFPEGFLMQKFKTRLLGLEFEYIFARLLRSKSLFKNF